MIGFIALSGVVIRNSLLLVDFMKQKIEEGKDINEAVIEGGGYEI
jgi:multidrug efflux pump subunit AcrB